MIVQHNIHALNAQRQFDITSKRKNKSSEKLSSGYRINRAADDAAGLAISEKMRRQIRGLNQGSENIQDGISLCQVADGAMNEVHDMLNRIEELLVKGANETLTDEDRQYISQEIDGIEQEVDRIGKTTEFNEIKVLQGYTTTNTHTETVTRTETVKELIGVTLGDTISYDTDPDIQRLLNMSGRKYHIGDYSYVTTYGTREDKNYLLDMSNVQSTEDWKSLHGVVLDMSCSLGCGATAQLLFDNTKTGITQTPSGVSSSAEYSHVNITVGTASYNNAQDFITDLMSTKGYWDDYHMVAQLAHDIQIFPASDVVPGAKANQLLFYGSQNMAHSPESDQGMIRAGRYNLEYQYNEYERTITEEVEVSEKERKKLWIQTGCESDDGFYIEIPHIDKDALGMSRISMNSSDESRRSIDYLKNMQNYVSEERSMMGAYQNRLEHSYNNNNNIAENTTAAESLIRDIDMSKEMVQQSIHNILEQAGISMMSNSNQTNQGVLQLLR